MSVQPAPAAEADVDVCICTFRRATLTDTIQSIARQRGFDGRLRIIVADNDETPSASEQVDRLRAIGQDIAYVHAPARNISIARNACLDQATAPLVAFIDDDEIADEYWLAELLAAMRRPGIDAVFGPVQAVYDPAAPAWMKSADLHSTRPVDTHQGIDTGYTSNALVRRSAIADLRFDLSLGRSGGEDTDLFTRLYARGSRFGAAPRGIVREQVTPSRMSLQWLAQRAFRSGQTHARRFLGSPATRIKAAVVALSKAAACGVIAITRLGSPSGWRRAVVRGSLHLGATSRLLGLRDRQIYG
ncbi:glycosyltransferase family 2 protein [soil metagenome]